jgi:hypothetical protein
MNADSRRLVKSSFYSLIRVYLRKSAADLSAAGYLSKPLPAVRLMAGFHLLESSGGAIFC